MSTFLTGKELEDTIYDIIWEADQSLLIVSPYIKLDDYFKELFDKHLNNPKLRLTVVFGKNEKDVNKSLRNTDFDFFKQFPNVSIIYVPDLHAKYYGNEKKGMITSINLYDYSFKNNIEFGVFSEQTVINKFSKSADVEAWNYCMDLAHDFEAIYVKRPVYKTKKAIISLGKEFIKSEVLLDLTDNFYGKKKNRTDSGKRLDDFPAELDYNVDSRPERVWEDKPHKEQETGSNRKWNNAVASLRKNEQEEKRMGYCIRTGEEIEFNPERPMSLNAFKKWNQFQDVNYGEAYCHYSGDMSFGKTSFAKPILPKYWKKAMSN
jgi:hypothetical protein